MRTPALRPMEFAGAWYPGTAKACAAQIEGWWAGLPADEGRRSDAPAATTRLGVVPHAGWVYSGRLAARVFHALGPDPDVQLALVLGGHLRTTDPVVAMGAGAWETPFGPVPMHTGFAPVLDALERDGALRLRRETPERYTADNSTELQLPFVRHAFPNAEALVMRVPPSSAALALGAALADYLALAGARS